MKKSTLPLVGEYLQPNSFRLKQKHLLAFCFLLSIIFQTTILSAQSSALLFDADDFVQVNDHPDLNFGNDNFTIEANFNVAPNPNSGLRPIISKADLNSNGFLVAIQANGDLLIRIGSHTQVTSVDLADGRCHNLIINRDKIKINVFLDGDLINTYNTGVILNVSSTADLFIGHYELNGESLRGSLIGLNLFNEDLRFNDLHEKGSDCLLFKNHPSLVAQWIFNISGDTQILNDLLVQHHGVLGSSLFDNMQDPEWIIAECAFQNCCEIDALATGPSQGMTGDLLTFENNSATSDPSWFIDGMFEDNTDVFEPTFCMPGIYLISMLVEDNNGECRDVLTFVVEISGPCTCPNALWPVIQFPTTSDRIQVRDIIVDNFGDIIITGKIRGGSITTDLGTETSLFSRGDFFLAKLGSCGKIEWFRRSFNNNNNTSNEAEGTAVAVDADNNIFVVGKQKGNYFYDTDGNNNNTLITSSLSLSRGIILAYDTDGDYLWNAQLNSVNHNDHLTAVQVDQVTGDIYAVGNVYQNGNATIINTNGTTYPIPATTVSNQVDRVLVKFFPGGITDWATTDGLLNDPNQDNSASILTWDHTTGTLLIGGDSNGNWIYQGIGNLHSGGSNIDIIRYNPTNPGIGMVNSRTLAVPSPGYWPGWASILDVEVNNAGDIFVSGFAWSPIDLGNGILINTGGKFLARYNNDLSNNLAGSIITGGPMFPLYRNIHFDDVDNIYLSFCEAPTATNPGTGITIRMTNAELDTYDPADFLDFTYAVASSPQNGSGVTLNAVTRNEFDELIYAGAIVNDADFNFHPMLPTPNSNPILNPFSITGIQAFDVFLARVQDQNNGTGNYARLNQEEPISEKIEHDLFDVKIFPNPNTGKFIIEVNSEKSFTIKLYNLQGQFIETISENEIGNLQKTVALNKVAPGIYFVQIQTASNLITKKIIVTP